MAHFAFNTAGPFATGIQGHSQLASPRSLDPRRRCLIRAAATPSKRTTGLSTLAATSVLAAATGGPSLAAWGAMFGVVGLATEAPVGLIAIAAGICGGIADLIAIDVGHSSFDTGLLPFVIFAVGSTVAGIIEASDGPAVKPVLPEEGRQVEIEQSRDKDSSEEGSLTAWDKALEKRDTIGGD